MSVFGINIDVGLSQAADGVAVICVAGFVYLASIGDAGFAILALVVGLVVLFIRKPGTVTKETKMEKESKDFKKDAKRQERELKILKGVLGDVIEDNNKKSSEIEELKEKLEKYERPS